MEFFLTCPIDTKFDTNDEFVSKIVMHDPIKAKNTFVFSYSEYDRVYTSSIVVYECTDDDIDDNKTISIQKVVDKAYNYYKTPKQIAGKTVISEEIKYPDEIINAQNGLLGIGTKQLKYKDFESLPDNKSELLQKDIKELYRFFIRGIPVQFDISTINKVLSHFTDHDLVINDIYDKTLHCKRYDNIEIFYKTFHNRMVWDYDCVWYFSDNCKEQLYLYLAKCRSYGLSESRIMHIEMYLTVSANVTLSKDDYEDQKEYQMYQTQGIYPISKSLDLYNTPLLVKITGINWKENYINPDEIAINL